MKKSHIPWSLKQFNRMYVKGSISFDHPIQRRGDQWNELQKSLLIHSLISDYPIPPLYAITEEVEGKNVYFILDGKQRLTVINSFFNNEFSLHADTPSVNIDHETFDIANKTYQELDEEVIEELESRTLTVYKFDEASEDEIEEVFFRLNNGVNLTKDQKSRAKLGSKLVVSIDELLNHPLVTELSPFTKLQIRRSEDQTILLQCLMLLSHFDYKDFSMEETMSFVNHMRNDFDLELFSELHQIFSYLADAYEKKETFMLKKIHFPMTIIQAQKALKMDISPNLFREWSNTFKKEFKDNKGFPYAAFCGHGTTKKGKIMGRLAEMDKHFTSYIKQQVYVNYVNN